MKQTPGKANDQHEAPVVSPLCEPLLDAEDAAALLSVRPSWIYDATRADKIPHIKIGRHLRFLRSDLEAWVLAQRRSA